MTFPKPKGKNSVSSTEILFNDRKYYKTVTIPQLQSIDGSNKVPFCDLIGRNALYGLLDYDNNIVVPKQENLSSIVSGNKKEQKVQSFVAAAFNEMRSYLSDAALIGKIRKSSPYYDIKAYKSYADPDLEIIIKTVLYAEEFKKQIISNNQTNASIKDYKDFTKHFIPFLLKKIKTGERVTKSGLVLATNFFSFSSGLILDIATDKADDDELKYDKYLYTPEFNIFKEACIRFGFMIDQNVPWRLVADINSPAMSKQVGEHRGYLLRENISSLEDMFNDRFNYVVVGEINYLKKMFFDSYIYFIKNNDIYEEDYATLCKRELRENTLKLRESTTEQQYNIDFPDTFWLRLFTYLRNYELRANLKQQQFENIVREANHYVKLDRDAAALIYVSGKFKDFTFPKVSVITNDIIF